MVLSDHSISAYCQKNPPMISPFVEQACRRVSNNGNTVPVVSYGLSAYGYDVRLSNEFKLFTNVNSGIIDILDTQPNYFVDYTGEFVVIPPNSYVLGYTVETFHMPRNVLGIALGKSSYARLGLLVNTTPLEPGWSGQLVLELANCTPLPLKVYANQGIAQIVFHQGDQDCKTSYAEKQGKYQNQTAITLAKL
jgi:dCTP deaminase